jgi:hypothetical protein
MGQVIDIIMGRPDHDALMLYLADHIGEIQHMAMTLQSQGFAFGDIVVPWRFGHLLSAGDVKVLGHDVIIGNVDRIGLVALPVN